MRCMNQACLPYRAVSIVSSTGRVAFLQVVDPAVTAIPADGRPLAFGEHVDQFGNCQLGVDERGRSWRSARAASSRRVRAGRPPPSGRRDQSRLGSGSEPRQRRLVDGGATGVGPLARRPRVRSGGPGEENRDGVIVLVCVDGCRAGRWRPSRGARGSSAPSRAGRAKASHGGRRFPRLAKRTSAIG